MKPMLEAPLDRQAVEVRRACGSTIYVRRFGAGAGRLRVVAFESPLRLDAWSRRAAARDALGGGFFDRARLLPLGEVWTSGVRVRSLPFSAPFDRVRAAVHVAPDGLVQINRRGDLPEVPDGDLLQAGPLLVLDGAVAYDRLSDVEGFHRASRQFDTDITIEPHPRAALGVTVDNGIVMVCCDGRAPGERGMLLEELAGLMVDLGCHSALNLDGGKSTTMVADHEVCNVPRSLECEVAPQPILTALAIDA